MFGFIRKFAEPRCMPPVEVDQLAGQLLRTLPRCTSRVAVASPHYGDARYRVEIVADTASLLPWAVHQAESVLGTIDEIQAAREAFPLWLRAADLGNPAITRVSGPLIGLLRPYARDFLCASIAQALCGDCRRFVGDLSFNSFNERKGDGWSRWVAEWRCAAGHVLYREDHGIRV